MVDLGTILDFVILAALAVGGLAWRSFSSGVEQAAKDQATEIVSQYNRLAVLSRKLEETRGTERQELRFTSYGRLWAEMRPLAIYDDSPIDQRTMEEMSEKLSDWYFSETGGLMLTHHNRDLYFALQDLVSAVARTDHWDAERTDKPKTRFEHLLQRKHLDAALALIKYLQDAKTQDWPSEDLEEMAEAWRKDILKLADDWAEIDGNDRFAVLQQVSSALRTGLANDVESRLR
jgi:hypothetical protein